jgi:6-phosphogluconate dehydrogenase (decarboxylating)
MMETKNEYGVIGLGRMGGNLARQAMEKGMRVVGFTRHGAPPDMIEAGLVEGARHGACFMAGGEQEAIALVEPILLELAIEDGYVHAGPPGAGHFTKLVHNGIEFGMLQAIAEGP